MADPLKASIGSQQGNWRKDNAGLMMPIGGSSSAKLLMQLPKEIQDIATSANVLVRGHFRKDLWPKLAMLSTIAGPDHVKTKMFIANITAGSMAEGGQASTNFLQGIVQMLVPSALPRSDGFHPPGKNGDKAKRRKDYHSKVVEDDDE